MRLSNLVTTYRKRRALVSHAARRARALIARLSSAQQSSTLTLRWPVGPYRFPSGPGYLTMMGVLSAALILQHVASTGAESDSGPNTANEVISPAGAGGNSIPRYLEPPPVPKSSAGTSLAASIRPQGLATETPAPRAVRGIPSTVLLAYERATDKMDRSQPGCHLSMPLLAAIGRVESGHAQGGNVDAVGTTRTPIVGPVLNGGQGVAAIRDTDGGAYDGDTVWDRAVGPMQFIPSTWRGWTSDGNSDGISDPHNVFDATLAASRYLCAAGRDLATSDGLRRAVLAYNHSEHYLNVVLSWMQVYAGGAVEIPNAAPRGHTGKGDAAGKAANSSRERADSPRRSDNDSGQQLATGPGPRPDGAEPRPRALSKPAPTSTPPPARQEPADDATDTVPVPSRVELPQVIPSRAAPPAGESVPIG